MRICESKVDVACLVCLRWIQQVFKVMSRLYQTIVTCPWVSESLIPSMYPFSKGKNSLGHILHKKNNERKQGVKEEEQNTTIERM